LVSRDLILLWKHQQRSIKDFTLPGGHCYSFLFTLAVFFVKVDKVGIFMLVGLFLVRTFSITGGFHRYFAHHTFKTNRFIQFCLAFIGGTCAQKGVLWWVAHHRHHHRFSDTEKDIHSAKREGFYWSHIGWMLSREYHTSFDPNLVKDLTKYPELVWLDKYHLVPPILLAAACYLSYGLIGLVWGFLLSTFLLYHNTFAVNSFCHTFGSQRYRTNESSKNTWWLSIPTLGEAWHNNHHHLPNSARHGFYWWEIDLTYYTLKLLSLFRIIKGLKVPSQQSLVQSPSSDSSVAAHN
jgi:stearoyl-CoA desaturase (Delta-9 desaturase)